MFSLSSKVLVFKAWLTRWWERHTGRQNVAAIVFVVSAIWFAISVVWGPTPVEFAVGAFNVVWPRMTPLNVSAFVALCVALAAGAVLWIGYYEQRAKVAEQEVRVMERDRDCNVLSKQFEDHRRQIRLLELERDGAISDLDAARQKEKELQGAVDGHPFALNQLRGELYEEMKSHAHTAMKLLVLSADHYKWTFTITIRFLDYVDHVVADHLEKYIHGHAASWNVITKHEPGDSIRPVHSDSRIEVASGAGPNSEVAARLSFAISYNRNFKGPVYHVGGSLSGRDVLITIFPVKAKAESNG